MAVEDGSVAGASADGASADGPGVVSTAVVPLSATVVLDVGSTAEADVAVMMPRPVDRPTRAMVVPTAQARRTVELLRRTGSPWVRRQSGKLSVRAG